MSVGLDLSSAAVPLGNGGGDRGESSGNVTPIPTAGELAGIITPSGSNSRWFDIKVFFKIVY